MSEWSEEELWALAETLSARMDAIEEGRAREVGYGQNELPLGPGGNVVFLKDVRGPAARDCAGRVRIAASNRKANRFRKS